MYLSQYVELKALFTENKQALASELDTTIALISNPEIRSSYMRGLREYSLKNPSDTTMTPIIAKSLKSSVGNNAYSKYAAYDALAVYKGNYEMLAKMLEEDPTNRSLIKAFVECANHNQAYNDCIIQIRNILDKSEKPEKIILGITGLSKDEYPWIMKDFLIPHMECKGKTYSTFAQNQYKTLFSS